LSDRVSLIANRLRPTGGLSGGKWTLNVTIQRRTFMSFPVSESLITVAL